MCTLRRRRPGAIGGGLLPPLTPGAPLSTAPHATNPSSPAAAGAVPLALC